jgi:hypothetical protein
MSVVVAGVRSVNPVVRYDIRFSGKTTRSPWNEVESVRLFARRGYPALRRFMLGRHLATLAQPTTRSFFWLQLQVGESQFLDPVRPYALLGR